MRFDRDIAIKVGLTTILLSTGACQLNREKQDPTPSSVTIAPTNTLGFNESVATAVAGTITAQNAIEASVAAVNPTSTSTETSTPTLTIAPTETPTQTATLLKPPPTDAGILPTSTQGGDLYDPAIVYPGELPFNNIREDETASERVWEEDLGHVLADYPHKAELRGSNSLLTSLTNEFHRGVGNPDPELEPGLGHTDEDIRNYQAALTDVLLHQDTLTVDKLVHYNTTTGLDTFGFYGDATSRDASSYLAAIAEVFAENPGMFDNSNGGYITVQEAMQNPQLRYLLTTTQEAIIAETQKRFLNLSDEEAQRRATHTPEDASNYIPAEAQTNDNFQSCDQFELIADDRINENQSTRLVTHDHNTVNNDTFNESYIETEGTLFAGTYDPRTGVWDVDAFTNRGYHDHAYVTLPDNQEFSSVGEQEFPCGEANAPVATAIPEAPVFFATPAGSPPQGGETPNTPDNTPQQPPTVTQAATQPPQATRTPGGDGSTPVVNTPLPTPRPTVETQPTAGGDPNTPSFGN